MRRSRVVRRRPLAGLGRRFASRILGQVGSLAGVLAVIEEQRELAVSALNLQRYRGFEPVRVGIAGSASSLAGAPARARVSDSRREPRCG